MLLSLTGQIHLKLFLRKTCIEFSLEKEYVDLGDLKGVAKHQIR